MARPVQVGDVCKFGHEIVGDNVVIRKIQGMERVRCAKCQAEIARRYQSSEKGRRAMSRKEARRRQSPGFREKHNEYVRLYRARKRAKAAPEGDDLVAKYDDKKTAVHKVLGVRPEAAKSWEKLNKFFDENRTACFESPDKFSDFDDPRYPEEGVGRKFPTAFEARILCSGCPVLELCGKFAAQNKEDFGVWGGKRYVGGKVYNG